MENMHHNPGFKPVINWELVPHPLMYYAEDVDGEGWFYTKEPHLFRDDDGSWIWIAAEGDMRIAPGHLYPAAVIEHYTGHWENSLCERW